MPFILEKGLQTGQRIRKTFEECNSNVNDVRHNGLRKTLVQVIINHAIACDGIDERSRRLELELAKLVQSVDARTWTDIVQNKVLDYSVSALIRSPSKIIRELEIKQSGYFVRYALF
jgi:hypothetical protein